MTSSVLNRLVCVAVVCFLPAVMHERALAAEVTAKLPAAVFSMDFEKDTPGIRIAKDAGIGGSGCLDVSVDRQPAGRAVPLVVTDRDVLAGLERVWSLTITGWLKTRVNFQAGEHKYILHCPGRFGLLYHGLYKGRLGLLLPGVTKAQDKQAWSSWFTPFLQHDRWMFFAVTYDGTRAKDNAGFYVGSETAAVEADVIESVRGGAIGLAETEGVIVGAYGAAGEYAFDGMLDCVRIYAGKEKKTSAALTKEQLEAIRRADLGEAWLRQVAETQRTSREAVAEDGNAKPRRGFRVVRVDVLDRVYPDREPAAATHVEPIHVPRGGTVGVQFAVRSETAGRCEMELSPIRGPAGAVLDGTARLYELVSVHVEANNNGGSRTSVTARPPGTWLAEFVRKAPFDVAEVLVERNVVQLEKERTAAFLVDVAVGREVAPGLYTGSLRLQCGQESTDVGFSLQVHKTVLPPDGWLNTTYWLSEDPQDLTSADPPAWWSEEHWRLLENSGRVLRAFGQDTIFTPIIDGKQPLIRTIRTGDGSFAFDYARFDRWFETFLRLGFRHFDGHHTGGGHSVGMPPMRPAGVYAWDETIGTSRPLFTTKNSIDDWLNFLAAFYGSLHGHLKEKGWIEHYAQCQLDEPHDFESYRKLAAVARKHMPGVKTKDAVNSQPERYSPLVDIHVFALTSLAHNAALARERRAKGQSVWVYHCCSPYPPYPNRHLDERLTDSRLYPWLAYLLKADGYLYWAANMYRGANPYKTSIGPVPGGSQNPGHPPGDNWFFYPGRDGLLGSLRMVAFRDGLIDHRLLTMLAERDPAAASRIMNHIARSIVDYQKDAVSFHKARRQLLNAFDQ